MTDIPLENKANDKEGSIVDSSGRRSSSRTVEQHGQVDIFESSVGEPPLVVPEREGGKRTGQQGPQEHVVRRSWTEQPCRSHQSPNGTGVKVDSVSWAREIVLLAWHADILHDIEEPLLDANLDDDRDAGSGELDHERCSGWHFDVMTQFEILGKHLSRV